MNERDKATNVISVFSSHHMTKLLFIPDLHEKRNAIAEITADAF